MISPPILRAVFDFPPIICASDTPSGSGQIDCLVNVAGVDIIAKLEDTSGSYPLRVLRIGAVILRITWRCRYHAAERWDRVMAVNLRSVFLCARECAWQFSV